MHQIQWRGTMAGWVPYDGTYYVSVATVIEQPEVAAWLDFNLAAWLRSAFADRAELQAEVKPPRQEEGSVPMTAITITGLKEPLPEPEALVASVAEAVVHAEELVAKTSARAEEYTREYRRLA